MGNRLNALDLAFLGLETQRTPVNVAALQIFKIPEGFRGNFVRHLLDELLVKTPGPPFNMKLNTTRLGRIPQWVEDPHFDLGYHVRHSALPKPGNMEDLLALVSRLHSRVLDRQRPLWEFHVIEGLKDRRFAIYMKMHHAAIDGMGGIALLEACLSPDPDAATRAPWQGLPEVPAQSEEAPAEETMPKPGAGWLHGATRQLRMMPDLGRLLAGNGMKVAGLRPALSPAPFTAPKSLFNAHISGARRFAIESISLSQIKALGKAAGVTVNDIVLATCAGALRRYLLKHKALPERALVATVPLSIRQINRSGNQITYVSANLATHVRNPLKRLAEISESTAEAKHEMAAVMPAAAMTFAVMAQGAVALLNRFRLADYLPPPANVVISNVPGPRRLLHFGGAPMLANYPLSVLVDGQALNITVVSYRDSVDFGLMACRDTVPDVDLIAGHIRDAFQELSTAIERRNQKKVKTNSKKRIAKAGGKKRPGRSAGGNKRPERSAAGRKTRRRAQPAES